MISTTCPLIKGNAKAAGDCKKLKQGASGRVRIRLWCPSKGRWFETHIPPSGVVHGLKNVLHEEAVGFCDQSHKFIISFSFPVFFCLGRTGHKVFGNSLTHLAPIVRGETLGSKASVVTLCDIVASVQHTTMQN